MNQSYAIAAYRSAQTTVRPLTAIVMLYDGALVHIHNAASAFSAGNYEVQFNETMRAAEILQALNAALDMERGASVAKSLRRFYEASAKALISSVAKKSSRECLERIERGVRSVRNTWFELANPDGGEVPSPDR